MLSIDRWDASYFVQTQTNENDTMLNRKDNVLSLKSVPEDVHTVVTNRLCKHFAQDFFSNLSNNSEFLK